MKEQLANGSFVDIEKLGEDNIISLISEAEDKLKIVQPEHRREAIRLDIGRFATELERRRREFNAECGVVGY